MLARFETPTSLGAFKIQCSKFDSLMNFSGNFLLVNSLHLIVENVEPNTIKLGESVSVSTPHISKLLLYTVEFYYNY